MASDILGPGWGRYFVGPIQFGLCYGAVVALTLLGGQSLKMIIILLIDFAVAVSCVGSSFTFFPGQTELCIKE